MSSATRLKVVSAAKTDSFVSVVRAMSLHGPHQLAVKKTSTGCCLVFASVSAALKLVLQPAGTAAKVGHRLALNTNRMSAKVFISWSGRRGALRLAAVFDRRPEFMPVKGPAEFAVVTTLAIAGSQWAELEIHRRVAFPLAHVK